MARVDILYIGLSVLRPALKPIGEVSQLDKEREHLNYIPLTKKGLLLLGFGKGLPREKKMLEIFKVESPKMGTTTRFGK